MEHCECRSEMKVKKGHFKQSAKTTGPVKSIEAISEPPGPDE